MPKHRLYDFQTNSWWNHGLRFAQLLTSSDKTIFPKRWCIWRKDLPKINETKNTNSRLRRADRNRGVALFIAPCYDAGILDTQNAPFQTRTTQQDTQNWFPLSLQFLHPIHQWPVELQVETSRKSFAESGVVTLSFLKLLLLKGFKPCHVCVEPSHKVQEVANTQTYHIFCLHPASL